jgi:hypothetical protein
MQALLAPPGCIRLPGIHILFDIRRVMNKVTMLRGSIFWVIARCCPPAGGAVFANRRPGPVGGRLALASPRVDPA